MLRAAFPAGTVSGAPEGARDGDHRRARADARAASTRAPSATSASRTTWTRRSRSARRWSRTACSTCRPAPASSTIRCPKREWQETLNKARAVLRAAEMVQLGLDVERRTVRATRRHKSPRACPVFARRRIPPLDRACIARSRESRRGETLAARPNRCAIARCSSRVAFVEGSHGKIRIDRADRARFRRSCATIPGLRRPRTSRARRASHRLPLASARRQACAPMGTLHAIVVTATIAQAPPHLVRRRSRSAVAHPVRCARSRSRARAARCSSTPRRCGRSR